MPQTRTREAHSRHCAAPAPGGPLLDAGLRSRARPIAVLVHPANAISAITVRQSARQCARPVSLCVPSAGLSLLGSLPATISGSVQNVKFSRSILSDPAAAAAGKGREPPSLPH